MSTSEHLRDRRHERSVATIGTKVRYIGMEYMSGVPHGAVGTVVKGDFGSYTDPAHTLVAVEWAGTTIIGVPVCELERLPQQEAL